MKKCFLLTKTEIFILVLLIVIYSSVLIPSFIEPVSMFSIILLVSAFILQFSMVLNHRSFTLGTKIGKERFFQIFGYKINLGFMSHKDMKQIRKWLNSGIEYNCYFNATKHIIFTSKDDALKFIIAWGGTEGIQLDK